MGIPGRVFRLCGIGKREDLLHFLRSTVAAGKPHFFSKYREISTMIGPSFPRTVVSFALVHPIMPHPVQCMDKEYIIVISSIIYSTLHNYLQLIILYIYIFLGKVYRC